MKKTAMIEYFEIKGKRLMLSLYALFINLIIYVFLEAFISVVFEKIRQLAQIGIESSLYDILYYALILQAIALFILVVAVSFRHKCIFV